MKNIIVAYGRNYEIGSNNQLLWNFDQMREDMEYFRAKTKSSTLIMGRKTLESIGVALPGRQNIVVTRNPECINIPNVEIASSLSDAYGMSNREEMFVIGGADIYAQAMNDVDRIYATEVDEEFDLADKHFPEIDEKWQKISSVDGVVDGDNIYPHKFVIYDRK